MGFMKLTKCCRIILHIEKDVLEDFSFSDVAKEMTKVFTDDELRCIQQEVTDTEQTERMLFLLMYKDYKYITVFQDVLVRDYDWLAEGISRAKESNEKFDDYGRCIRNSNIPNNRSGIIYRKDLLWQIRKKLLKLEECNYLVLHGNTGSGKRWLAIDACHDYRTIRAMNYKIFWLNMTDCTKPEKILAQMERLKEMFRASLTDKKPLDMDAHKNGYISVEAKIEAERNVLRQILQHESLKDCLLVLGDLCSDVAQNAFDLHCKILVTTRNVNTMKCVNESKKEMLSASSGFTELETFALFEYSLDKPVRQSHLRWHVSEIWRIVNGNPYYLALIAKNLLYIHDGNVERRLNEWIHCVRHGFENNRTKNIMDETLKVLDNEEAELYRKLAIFQPNCLIPIPVLEKYFSMNTIQVEELVNKFERLSLLETEPVDTHRGRRIMCRVHFTCAQYLARSARDDLVRYHRDFVDTYQIEKNFAARREPNVLDFPHDDYFYTFIGDHLCAGELFELFEQLFSDFGFLEEKIRASGLTNTIGDLKMYQDIVGTPTSFVELQYFLPNIEDRIYQTRDLTLLQQALGAPPSLRELARDQIEKFPNRVWFRTNCGEKSLKIVQLCSNPSILRFVSANSVLVAQKDHNIVQTDLRNNYIPNVYKGHEAEIVQMEVFAKSFLISLDVDSVMCMWYIGKEDRKSENGNSTNKRQFAGHLNYNINNAPMIETLQKITIPKNNKVVCFHTFFDGKCHKLLCALDSSDVLTFNWAGNKFVAAPGEKFSAQLKYPEKIKCLRYIGSMKVLVLVTDGKIYCYSLKDHASLGFTKPPIEGEGLPIDMHYNSKKKLVYLVFARMIVQIKIRKCNKLPFLYTKYFRLIYRPKTPIECSALAKNGKFLVLGTSTGIIVYDCQRRVEVQQNCVAERVACIDVVTSRDLVVIFGSASKHNLANIFEIKMHKQAVALQKNLFEMLYHDKVPTLYAVDAKRRLHEYTVHDGGDIVRVQEKNWTIRPPQNVTAMTSSRESVYIGCDDGWIFQWRNCKWIKISQAPYQVDFLKYTNDVLVVGTTKAHQILHQQWHAQCLRNCYAADAEHLLAITKDMSAQILHMDSNQVISVLDGNMDLNFCDFSPPYLLTCANRQPMYVYSVQGGEMTRVKSLTKKIDAIPMSVAVSTGKDNLAVGFQNGAINLYDIGANFRYIKTLESHKGAVTYLEFSPWCTNGGQILISLGEQMCFWTVRCNKRRYVDNELPIDGLKIGNINPWDDKVGASEKPELLSCLKFAGNSATKILHDGAFVRFLTIDNEGEIYVLSLHNTPSYGR